MAEVTSLSVPSQPLNPDRRLTDADVGLIPKLVGELLPGELYQRVLDIFEEQLRETRSLGVSIQVLSSLAEGQTVPAKLDFIASLYRLADGYLPLVSLIAKDASVVTVSEAASKYYAFELELETDHSMDPPRMAAFRAELFAAEPTAVLVLAVLRAAVSKGFHIGREPMSIVLNNAEIMSSVPMDKTAQVKSYLGTLQRLQALVTAPEDVEKLLQKSFTSAHDIASTEVDLFIRAMGEAGVSAESATRIHKHAIVVDIHNEAVWAAALSTHPGIVPRAAEDTGVAARASAAAAAAGGSTESDVVNLSTMFDMESMDCEDCSSFTSPAAYFVDLLRTLWNCKISSEVSLLDKLLDRRPDLKFVQLSCANTEILIPHIDLVNEVLESVVQTVNVTARVWMEFSDEATGFYSQ
ncbi:hypothetical protein FN846DRAFT_1008681 [Sphaerosporella brunnea]|uniref:Uncharacterized protein n=1 Tax=Sphaerosporella brunnea TaxID=1250544 RepID=A0A5J5EBY9_9PEZI|nr:hypothetical protein FN846DRAFT_1008681 [Sphaerosporella brunnea]